MVARLSAGGTPTVGSRHAGVPENSNPGSVPSMPSLAQQYRMEVSGRDLMDGHGLERSPPTGRHVPQVASPALHVNPEKAAYKRSSHSGPNAEHDLVKELEETDLGTYPALKHAFELLAAGYRSQRATHEADEMRWAMEVQELQSGEAHLLEAIQAVRDALESETRAHDLDLRTLNALVKKNMELDETVNHLKVLLGDRNIGDRLLQDRPVGHVRDLPGSGPFHRSFTEGRSSIQNIESDHDSTIHSQDDVLHGIKPALRKRSTLSHDHGKDKNGDHVFGHQRYCPETDSYRLVTHENQQISKEHLQQQHDALAKKVMDLNTAFQELADENARLRELCNPESLEAGLAQGHFAARPAGYEISGISSPPPAGGTVEGTLDQEAPNPGLKGSSHVTQQGSLAIRDTARSPEYRRNSNDPSFQNFPRAGEAIRSSRNSSSDDDRASGQDRHR